MSKPIAIADCLDPCASTASVQYPAGHYFSEPRFGDDEFLKRRHYLDGRFIAFQYRCCREEAHPQLDFWFDSRGNSAVEPRGYVCPTCYGAELRSRETRIVAPGGPQAIELTIPPMYASAALDRTPDGKLFNATTRKRLESWPRQERMMLVIGPRGCGKTHCGWARARDLARSGLKTFFVDLLKWQADWEHAISGFQRARAERMENAIRRAPFAILDDLSGTTASDRWNHELQSVLDERIGNRLATWVTTAADLDAVAEKFNPAIASRLQMFFQTTLPPRDWREYRAPKPEPEARTHDFEGEL